MPTYALAARRAAIVSVLYLAPALAACDVPTAPSSIPPADLPGSAGDTALPGDGTPESEPAPDVPVPDQGNAPSVPEWSPPGCEAPPTLPADPLWLVDAVDEPDEPGGYQLTHLTDVAIEPGGGRVYAAGIGGLHVFDVSDGGLDLIGIRSPPIRMQSC